MEINKTKTKVMVMTEEQEIIYLEIEGTRIDKSKFQLFRSNVRGRYPNRYK